MKIKLIKDTELEDGKHKAGEMVDPVFEIANQLLATGSAELPGAVESKPQVKHPEPQVEPEAVEEIAPVKKARKSHVS